MPIPKYEEIMLPLLCFLSDGKVHRHRDVVASLIAKFNLSETEINQLLPSGAQTIFANRTGWARTYLSKAGLIESSQRGSYSISEKGRRVLESKPPLINTSYLKRFPEFLEFKMLRNKSNSLSVDDGSIELTGKTIEEILEESHKELLDSLSEELLSTLKSCSPLFFEKLVVDLMLKMGYGGSRKDAGKVIGKSGDGGIDGIIKEDKLGLNEIYIQAKRWDAQVPVKEVRDFAGSLLGKKAKRGIFITTSAFPSSAYEYVNSIEHKIVLIDGADLVDLMIEHNLGVDIVRSFDVKKIDTDYFSEE